MKKKIEFYKFLAKNRKLNIVIEGHSMDPVLKTGDTIYIVEDNIDCIGGVVAFLFNDEIVAHRLLKIENDVFYCKGDHSASLESVLKSQVIGSVRMFQRRNTLHELAGISENEALRLYRICTAIKRNRSALKEVQNDAVR